MRMKARFMATIEVVGKITQLKEKDGWLIMNVRTTTPAGWDLHAALTHEDIVTMLKFMLKPSNILYVLFGFGKPRDENQVPEY
jgi:hypothetical protein